jgi:lipopolysaccharide export system permease protein
MPFVTTLHRYFATRFINAVLAIFLGVFALVAMVDYVELVRRTADVADVSGWSVAKASLYRVPQITERLLPFCVLLAGMVTFLNLSRRLELVIARAAGMSAWQFIAPAIFVALIVGTFATTIYNPVSAFLQEQSKLLQGGPHGKGYRRPAASDRQPAMGASAQQRGPVDRQCAIEPGARSSPQRNRRLHLRP